MAKIKRSIVLLLACAILAGTVFTPFKAVKAAEDDNENENVEVVYETEQQPDEKPETEELTEDKERSCHSTDGCCVGGDLPPHIDEGTDHLDAQCR